MISIGPIGIASSYPYTDDAAVVADEARRVERLGFSTLWRSGNLPMLDAAVRQVIGGAVDAGEVLRPPRRGIVDVVGRCF